MRTPPLWFGLLSGTAVSCFAAPQAPIVKESPEQEAAWREVLRLDAGPQGAMEASTRMSERYASHLLEQEAALRRFLLLAPKARSFEANFRLVRVLALRSEMEGNATLQDQADALLERLEQQALPPEQAHIAFERISQWMRRNRLPSREQRLDLLAAAREFRDRFPADPRVPRLLVEVATQFDRDPERKLAILEDAQKLTRDATLRRRIEDDLRKLGLLGKPLQLKFTGVDGRVVSLEQMRGKPVVLLYVSGNAQTSLLGWKNVSETLQSWPEVQRVCVSMDEDRVSMERIRKDYGEGWLLGWDGMGWNSPLARRWGINAVPTSWLLDAQGRLVSLNAREDLEGQLQALKGAGIKPGK